MNKAMKKPPKQAEVLTESEAAFVCEHGALVKEGVLAGLDFALSRMDGGTQQPPAASGPLGDQDSVR